jgi:biopolymer transport protein ExbD
MPLKTLPDELPQLNMTPMIDCVFLLLIFFLVATRLEEQAPQIPLQLPEVVDRGALSPAPEKLVVSVYWDGSITLDNRPVNLEALTEQLAILRRHYPDLAVMVRGDARAPYQHVAQVLNACKQAGIRELNISVRTVSLEKAPASPPH